MVGLGLFLAFASGVCNGLFTAPMKIIRSWKWEHIWLVFIITSCILMPLAVISATVSDFGALRSSWPATAVLFAVLFGFAWGFGAILFGLSVDRLGVSLANSLVIGISSAMGSLVPLLVQGTLRLEPRQLVLFFGIATYLAGVWLCGAAGRRREGNMAGNAASGRVLLVGYLFSIGAGVMSAVFNIGYSLALPIAEAGVRLGYSRFVATNAIWLLMLGAGSIPNIVFCAFLAGKHRNSGLFFAGRPYGAWGLSVLMGLLWGGSIFLYGAATPLLGNIGPSIGWPLSLAVGLLVANLMGVLLGEWRKAGPDAIRLMRFGILILLVAVVICAIAAKIGVA